MGSLQDREASVLRYAVRAAQDRGILKEPHRNADLVVGRHLRALNLFPAGASSAGPASASGPPLSPDALGRLIEKLVQDEAECAAIRRKEDEEVAGYAGERARWLTAKDAAKTAWHRDGASVQPSEASLPLEESAAPPVPSSIVPVKAAAAAAGRDDVLRTLERIARGDLSLASKLSSLPEFFLFVSSTFIDTTAERDYMQKNVFPDIRDLCQTNGLNFVVVDLRWGVRQVQGEVSPARGWPRLPSGPLRPAVGAGRAIRSGSTWKGPPGRPPSL